jgi:hypothetical protein
MLAAPILIDRSMTKYWAGVSGKGNRINPRWRPNKKRNGHLSPRSETNIYHVVSFQTPLISHWHFFEYSPGALIIKYVLRKIYLCIQLTLKCWSSTVCKFYWSRKSSDAEYKNLSHRRRHVLKVRKQPSFPPNRSPKLAGTIHFMIRGRFGVFQKG